MKSDRFLSLLWQSTQLPLFLVRFLIQIFWRAMIALYDEQFEFSILFTYIKVDQWT